MATQTDPTIDVIIEDGIYAAMSRFLQAAANEHGLRIERLDAQWVDASSVRERKLVLASLTMVITSKPLP